MRVYCGKHYANLKNVCWITSGASFLAYPNVIVCLTGGSKSEFRKSQIWISRTTNGKKQWWEMNRRGSLFPSPATCGQGISPPTASAEQSIGQDKTAGLLWVPQRDYVQPSCSLQLFLQNAAVHHNVFWLSSSNTVFGEWVRPNINPATPSD